MFFPHSSTALAAVMALGFSGATIAQEATFRPADANQDGYVTQAEMADHRAMQWAEIGQRSTGSLDTSQPFMGQMEGRPGRSANPDPGLIGGPPLPSNAAPADLGAKGVDKDAPLAGPMEGKPERSPNPDPGKIGGTSR